MTRAPDTISEMHEEGSSEAPAMIDLREVTKRYGSKVAVSELSLQVPAGELFAFLGPNGAGKTTTIKMLTGLLRATSGSVLIAGHEAATASSAIRGLISYVPDQPFVYEKLSGREFLHFTREIQGLSGSEVERYEGELIDLFEMRDYVDDLSETYSHGMRQRLAFVSALLHRPKVLIVDEPMVGLDPKSVRIVKDLLRDSALGGATVFMSTHTLTIAEEVADRIGIIHQGRLVRCGSMAQLREEGAEGLSLEEFFLGVTAESQT